MMTKQSPHTSSNAWMSGIALLQQPRVIPTTTPAYSQSVVPYYDNDSYRHSSIICCLEFEVRAPNSRQLGEKHTPNTRNALPLMAAAYQLSSIQFLYYSLVQNDANQGAQAKPIQSGRKESHSPAPQHPNISRLDLGTDRTSEPHLQQSHRHSPHIVALKPFECAESAPMESSHLECHG